MNNYSACAAFWTMANAFKNDKSFSHQKLFSSAKWFNQAYLLNLFLATSTQHTADVSISMGKDGVLFLSCEDNIFLN